MKRADKIGRQAYALREKYDAKIPPRDRPMENYHMQGITTSVTQLLDNVDAAITGAERIATSEGFIAGPVFLLDAAEALLEAARKVAMAEATLLTAETD